ncbi:uncharacterized protein LOC120611035 [Pteropus medius]|uniref:uncharacterized protein LOC120611035 n=1 Tax=Pteropus vampyrus TaxID=132908 RepID=UPI00196B6CAC|nr:uncharacterized protein LOC120611035 [Pteropus giganteus]
MVAVRPLLVTIQILSSLASKYYEKEALLVDPLHLWSLLSELIQRQQDHSSHQRQNPANKRPALCASGVDGEVLWGFYAEIQTWPWWQRMEWSPEGHPGPHPPSPLTTARRDTRLAAWRTGHPSLPMTMWSPCIRTPGYLLYGKNNVLVQPVRVHLGPKSSILGLDLGHRGVFSGFQVTHPFIYSSTYSLIYSFIFQYFLDSIQSFNHMPFTCQYILPCTHPPSIHPYY